MVVDLHHTSFLTSMTLVKTADLLNDFLLSSASACLSVSSCLPVCLSVQDNTGSTGGMLDQ